MSVKDIHNFAWLHSLHTNPFFIRYLVIPSRTVDGNPPSGANCQTFTPAFTRLSGVWLFLRCFLYCLLSLNNSEHDLIGHFSICHPKHKPSFLCPFNVEWLCFQCLLTFQGSPQTCWQNAHLYLEATWFPDLSHFPYLLICFCWSTVKLSWYSSIFIPRISMSSDKTKSSRVGP